MKTKLLAAALVAVLCLAAPGAFAKKRVIRTERGRTVVVNSGSNWNHHRWHSWHDSSVSVGVGLGFGFPFYGGYYGGYYPGYYGAYYPYATTAYYPYGYSYYPYGYGYYPYSSAYYTPYYARERAYGYSGSLVARVQQRLARAGYYAGPIDGVVGPRTRYAIRAFERRHGLPPDGVIDRRLLASLGLA